MLGHHFSVLLAATGTRMPTILPTEWRQGSPPGVCILVARRYREKRWAVSRAFLRLADGEKPREPNGYENKTRFRSVLVPRTSLLKPSSATTKKHPRCGEETEKRDEKNAREVERNGRASRERTDNRNYLLEPRGRYALASNRATLCLYEIIKHALYAFSCCLATHARV